MATSRFLALVMAVVGFSLLFLAYQSFQGLGGPVTEAVEGTFNDSTTWLLVLGAASAVVGVITMLFGKSPNH